MNLLRGCGEVWLVPGWESPGKRDGKRGVCDGGTPEMYGWVVEVAP
ncbi:MAG: hypothetical protein KBG16_10945 [Methanospirillum sp.]|nr:hypothetical protein [Methanospirillum sp.]